MMAAGKLLEPTRAATSGRRLFDLRLERGAAMSLEETHEITALANGVRVASEKMPNVASTTVGGWVGAGARHETAEENGLAHFLEHMAFKGTGRRTSRQIVDVFFYVWDCICSSTPISDILPNYWIGWYNPNNSFKRITRYNAKN